MPLSSPLQSLRSKYDLTETDLLQSFVNRAGEPISERTLSGLLAGRCQLAESILGVNSENLARTITLRNPRLKFEDIFLECRAVLREYRWT